MSGLVERTDHVHTPELRERRHYDAAVIAADAWVCAECEGFLGAVGTTREEKP